MNSRKKIADPLFETSASDLGELPRMLREASIEPLSSDQKRRQRLEFVYGQMPERMNMDRDEVKELLRDEAY